MRIAISGPTGAIGMALMIQCIEQNLEVVAICRKGSKRLSRIPNHPNITVLLLDIEDYATFERQNAPKEIKDCDVFYHFAWRGTIGAARNDTQLQHQNIGYTLDAVRLAKELCCHTFIGAGSQAEYGRVDGLLKKDTPTFPENGYGIAKLCAGQLSRIQCEQVGIKHIWTRILSVYGPFDGEETMITTTIRKLLRGEVPACTKGEQMWDYLFSADAARAMLCLAKSGQSGKIYPVGSGVMHPLNRYIETLKDYVDINLSVGFGQVPYAKNQVMHLCADISELTKDTGFKPQVRFEDGIRQAIAWAKETM